MEGKINVRAASLRKKEQRPLTAPGVSLEYAQLIAQRRACRVAENRQLEQNNQHFYNLKNSIELENAFNERQRMEDRLRIGSVPASISHPIAAEMVRRAAVPVVAMEVDQPEADAAMGRAEANAAYNHTHVEFPKICRMVEFNKGGKPLPSQSSPGFRFS